MQELVPFQFTKAKDLLDSEKKKSFASGKFIHSIPEEVRQKVKISDLMSNKEQAFALMMPDSTLSVRKMESFFYYSSNLAWLQYRSFLFYSRKLFANTLQGFIEAMIGDQMELSMEFNRFLSDVLQFV